MYYPFVFTTGKGLSLHILSRWFYKIPGKNDFMSVWKGGPCVSSVSSSSKAVFILCFPCFADVTKALSRTWAHRVGNTVWHAQWPLTQSCCVPQILLPWKARGLLKMPSKKTKCGRCYRFHTFSDCCKEGAVNLMSLAVDCYKCKHFGFQRTGLISCWCVNTSTLWMFR